MVKLHDVKTDIEKKLMEGKIEPQKAVEQYASSLKPLSGRVFKPSDTGTRMAQYDRDEALRERALAAQVPFINADTGLFLYPGLCLVGGVSGQGKSTLSSNILAGFVESSKKKAVVITNEESLGSIYNRVGCIRNSVSFNKYHKNALDPRTMKMVQAAARDVMEQVIVIDDDAWDMSVLEDVQAVLEYAATADIGIVIVDYHQTIVESREDALCDPYQVLKRFGFYLKDYARKVAIPVVNLAQLRTGEGNADVKDRVEGDRTIYNHALQVIEVLPDFQARNSKFKVVKDRFGQQNMEITMAFVDGKFEMSI